MLNQLFMKSLVMLEAASATEAEKNAINEVRGLYVAKYANDNTFVNSLAKLEAAAATDAEKHEINKIRGRFGELVLTESQTTSQTDDPSKCESAATAEPEQSVVESNTSYQVDPDVIKNNKSSDEEFSFEDWGDVMKNDPDRMMLDEPEDFE